MKKVLITGSSGYIGTNLKELFKKEGIEYVEVDRQIGLNAEDYNDFSEVDGVVHLAARSGIPSCEMNPQDAAISNLSATYNVFCHAFMLELPVVFASSQAAKSPNEGIYGFTKYAAEQEAFRLNRQGGKIRVYRFANVYGGLNYEKKNTVVSMFMRAKLSNKPIIVNGDGFQTRDFIHVDDICRAIYLGLITDVPVDEPIDVGSGEEKSILDLARMFNHRYVFDRGGRAGVSSSVADVRRAKRLLGFEVEKSLKDYVEAGKI